MSKTKVRRISIIYICNTKIANLLKTGFMLFNIFLLQIKLYLQYLYYRVRILYLFITLIFELICLNCFPN